MGSSWLVGWGGWSVHQREESSGGRLKEGGGAMEVTADCDVASSQRSAFLGSRQKKRSDGGKAQRH